MPCIPDTPVRKRCFVQMIGYEPITAAYQHYRFVREMARFRKVWNVQSTVTPPQFSADRTVANWKVESWGPNWRVATDYYCFDWGDLVIADARQSEWKRFPLGLASIVEFILTGTAFRYFSVSPRYPAFFLYPLVVLGGMIWLSVVLTRFVMHRTGWSGHMLLVLLAALGLFALLWLVFGRMLALDYAFDDWHFARKFVHRRQPQLEQRLDRFARELVRLARDTDADEIVLHGQSFGAPLLLLVIDRALRLDPQLGRGGKQLHLVSVGSSLLKVALHPRAAWLREAAGRVANDPAVYWVDFQSLIDVLNAYKVDPIAALGLPHTGKPIIKIIHIHNMLEEATYRRVRLNFLRIHRQSVMGNERRYFYDYQMLCCGPLPLADRVADSDRAVSVFAADGTFLDHAGEAASAAGAAEFRP